MKNKNILNPHRDLIAKWHADDLSSRRIAAQLFEEKGVIVSYKAVQRFLSDSVPEVVPAGNSVPNVVPAGNSVPNVVPAGNSVPAIVPNSVPAAASVATVVPISAVPALVPGIVPAENSVPAAVPVANYVPNPVPVANSVPNPVPVANSVPNPVPEVVPVLKKKDGYQVFLDSLPNDDNNPRLSKEAHRRAAELTATLALPAGSTIKPVPTGHKSAYKWDFRENCYFFVNPAGVQTLLSLAELLDMYPKKSA